MDKKRFNSKCFSQNVQINKIKWFLVILNVIVVMLSSLILKASPKNTDEVLRALEKNDRKLARIILNKLVSQPESKLESSILLMFMNNIEGKEENLAIMKDILPLLNDPNPYLYSLWFDEAVTNGYGKKEEKRINFLKSLLNDKKINESIKASLMYAIGLHNTFINNNKEADKYYKDVKSIKDWQFAGPFDNISGSGFDKNYGPLDHPEPEYVFKSKTNADIKWFTPKYPQRDPWVSSSYHLPTDQCVMYGQTFVNSSVEQDVILSLGAYGSFKVWVNDQLALEQEEENKTDLEVSQKQIKLRIGENRILIQLGFTNAVDYPNFIVRILNKKGEPIDGLTINSTYKKYMKGTKDDIGIPFTHFAEYYFENKIKEDPDNILNYILLSKAYYRSQKHNQAIEILKKAQQLYPNNIFINYELILNYNKMNDRTELIKQIEHIRSMDPDFLLLAYYDFNINFDNENYTESKKYLQKIKEHIGGDDENYISNELKQLKADHNYQTLYDEIERAYNKYPENTEFVKYKFQILKNRNLSEEAIIILEKYLKNNYNAKIFEMLMDEYTSLGNKSKVEKSLTKMNSIYPEEIKYIDMLTNYYYNIRDFKSSLDIVNKGLTNSPYNVTYLSNRGYIDEALKNDRDAIIDFNKAIQYNPNLFDEREQIRQLQDKKPILSYFKDPDVYETIKTELEKMEKTDDNYQYIFYNKNYAVYPEGAFVEYTSVALKVQNKSGLDYWKDASISYNDGRQKLIIEKAEVIKQNGQKVTAEQNGNRLVFPSLEINDVVYIEYRINNYTSGLLSKDFFDTFVFNDFVNVSKSKYRLLTPKNYKFEIKTKNIDIKPKKTEIEDFDSYEWEFINPAKCKHEDYMPSNHEIGMVLNISSIENWKKIAEWYNNIAIPQAKQDYNVIQAYNKIFENRNPDTDFKKAKAIYDYISKNIGYSSVSFRQSNYIPQKPLVTLSTQLGDCKDLSILYYTLAKMAGLNVHIVLVNTRDNGEETIKLPSVEFNHVIVKINLSDRVIYQELTDDKLMFGSMPNNLLNSQALIIPNTKDDPEGTDLIHIPSNMMNNNEISRNIFVKVDNDNNLNVKTEFIANGNIASISRHKYCGLNNNELEDKIKADLNSNFENKLILSSYNIDNLEEKDSIFRISCNIKLDGEVKSIGNLKAVKLPFFEKIFTNNVFVNDERHYPIIYSKYEDTDFYNTEIIIELPKGSLIEKLPDNTEIKNDFINYKLIVEKLKDNTIKFTRKVKIDTKTISESYYNEFRNTIKKILKAEDVYIAYK
ncbi:MAG: DUF3857 domain-containing protein [Bacteroidota bacterium]|nr:DUF3857 domain-containing protein [Bacteroidota bacterium]